MEREGAGVCVCKIEIWREGTGGKNIFYTSTSELVKPLCPRFCYPHAAELSPAMAPLSALPSNPSLSSPHPPLPPKSRFASLLPKSFHLAPRPLNLSSSRQHARTRKPFLVACQIGGQVRDSPSLTASHLQEKFGCEGLQFSDVAGMTVVELKLTSGSSARVLLPGALITSYKARMWHQGVEEMLHTEVSTESDQEPVLIGGGIALSFCHDKHPLFEGNWLVDGVNVNPQESVQVILRHIEGDAVTESEVRASHSLSIQYVITLSESALISAVIISNRGHLPVEFTGSVSTHLAVSTVEAVFAIGLRGCNFCSPPLPPESLSEVEPSENTNQGLLGGWPLMKNLRKRLWDPSGSSVENHTINQGGEKSSWFTEKDDYAPFKSGMRKVYLRPWDRFTILDRGKRRSLTLGRLGFDNVLLSSGGFDLKLKDENDYVCVGPASILDPVILSPGQTWKAAQILQNPNT